MAPVFSLVLDEDVSADIALMYPELYQELMKVLLKDKNWPNVSCFICYYLYTGSFTYSKDILYLGIDQYLSRYVVGCFPLCLSITHIHAHTH